MRLVRWVLLCGLLLGVVGQAQDVELPTPFRDAALGYEIRYPADWIYEFPSEGTVVFSGDFWTDAYYATVTLRRIASSLAGGVFGEATEVVADLKCQLVTGSPSVEIRDGEPWGWQLTSGPNLVGPEFFADFERDGERSKAWYVVFPHPDGLAFASFTYTAPVDTYDTYLGIAEAMFEAWRFLTESGSEGGTPPMGSPAGN